MLILDGIGIVPLYCSTSRPTYGDTKNMVVAFQLVVGGIGRTKTLIYIIRADQHAIVDAISTIDHDAAYVKTETFESYRHTCKSGR